MIFKYKATDQLSARQIESLASKLVYSTEHIHGCSVDGETNEISLQYDDEQQLDSIKKTLAKMVANEQGIRPIKQRILCKSNGELKPMKEGDDSIHELFPADGAVQRGLAIQLFEKTDRLFTQISDTYAADLRKYPSLISAAALAKCNYLNNFPQNAFLVSEFPHQLEILEQVRNSTNYAELSRPTSYILAPAVCFHCYEELSSHVSDKPLIFTAKGTCYRHEAKWRMGKHRLNEFSMREIIYLGPAEFVESTRQHIMEQVWSMFGQLGLFGRIETASDPFYFPQDAIKKQHQLMSNMKYELVVELNQGRDSFSIASFNNVKNTLCTEFDIKDSKGDPLHSGCVAFGIDRWVYALLLNYGSDWSEWPESVRKILG
jgi:hypothetical protein